MLSVDLRLIREDAFRLELAFEAQPGLTVLYGPSGAGKSSVLDCVAGAVRPDAGRISLGDALLFDAETGVHLQPRLRRTPRVYQDGRLFPHLDVRANLLYGSATGARFEEVVQALEIGELLERRPHQLSGGQGQRVAVGRALLTSPRALLLDEPLASLDLPLRRRILPYLRELPGRFAIPFLYVTHSLEEALVLGDRVLVLEDGQLVADGPPAQVLAHGPSAPHAGVLAGDSLLEVVVRGHRGEEGITDCGFGEATLHCLRLDAQAGDRLFLALSARDVLLARRAPEGLSARNLVPSRVEALVETRDHIEAELSFVGAPENGPSIVVSLTPQATREMDLVVGSEVVAVFKASALRPVAS